MISTSFWPCTKRNAKKTCRSAPHVRRLFSPQNVTTLHISKRRKIKNSLLFASSLFPAQHQSPNCSSTAKSCTWQRLDRLVCCGTILPSWWRVLPTGMSPIDTHTTRKARPTHPPADVPNNADSHSRRIQKIFNVRLEDANDGRYDELQVPGKCMMRCKQKGTYTHAHTHTNAHSTHTSVSNIWATVVIGVFAQGCGSCSQANISKTGSVPILKTLSSEKPRHSLPRNVFFNVGNLPVV